MITEARTGEIAARLSEVEGIVAVTLGGSRARGTHHTGSDVDLGLYYEPRDLNVAALARLATDVCGRPVTVAGPGGWGPWVDGGAWLAVDGIAVDWILRDVHRVAEQCARACAGEMAFHIQTGHPLGFWDATYAGEVATGLPLADHDGLIPKLRDGLVPYPPALRRTMLGVLGEAEFVANAAHKGSAKSDTSYVAICCSRALILCAHAWHAHAGVWALNEKGLVPDTRHLPVATGIFADEAQDVLAHLGATPERLVAAASRTVALVAQTRAAIST